ncbi:MAG: CmcJ/NvfI family oxidoreductase, partial [Gammaproteobacteria bacterium]
MTNASDAATAPPLVGAFNYLTASVEHSLYRNGKVYTRRDLDGSDARWEGAHLESQQMPVYDARRFEATDTRSLAANGFELQPRPLVEPDIDFFNHEQLVRKYYPQCAEIVRAAIGVRIAAAFDHNIRSASGKQSKRRIEGGQQVQGPAHVVHGDYTLTSAVQRLRDLTRPPTGNDTLRSVLGDGASLLNQTEVEHAVAAGRFAIINVWRNIAHEPVATYPLALCDASSVRPEDLVVFEIHYPDRIGENYFARHSNLHRWYFYPALTRDEALLIKQWDSAGELARSKGARADSH